jgi:hypothetical protein
MVMTVMRWMPILQPEPMGPLLLVQNETTLMLGRGRDKAFQTGG